MEKFEDKYVMVSNYRTRYWDVGGHNKQTIILLHGYALSVENWGLNFLELSNHFHVVALDLWGFGKTDALLSKVEIEELPILLLEFMKVLNLDKVHLIGHSMGGLIAMRFAQLFPANLKSLVLVAAAGIGIKMPINFRLLSIPLLGEFLIKPNKKRIMSSLKKCTYLKSAITPAFVETMYELSLKPGLRKSLLKNLRNAVNIWGFKKSLTFKIRNDFSKLKLPVLILWGKQDTVVNIKYGQLAFQRIPNSQFVMLDNCGHFLHIEYPQEFNKITKDFFLRLR